MKKFKLKNGITLIYERNSSRSVAIEVMFNFGSNDETKDVAGIAHFLEHMLFEGTKTRKNSLAIANEIERYGGEFNAYTAGERTAFFIKIINKRLDIALDILSDMVTNPLFDDKIINKEKKVVLKEINMVTDDPRLHQWVLFHRELFEKHPARNPTYGTSEAIKSFNSSKISSYYEANYNPKNMIISIIGNVPNPVKIAEKYFGKLKAGNAIKRNYPIEPAQKKMKQCIEKRKTHNSYMVLGYKTVPKFHNDSLVLDLIAAVLGRGQSGWIFNEIRNKRGLAYQVGVHNENESTYGSFAVFAGLDKKNIDEARKIIMEQFGKLQSIGQKDFNDAKTYLEGSLALQAEDNFQRADNLSVWETVKDAKFADSYINGIKKISVEQLKRVAKKYLTENYTLVVIEQE